MSVSIGLTMHCKFLTNGIRINEDGSVVPCCEFTGNLGINISKNFNFEEYFSSEQVTSLKDQLSNNSWPDHCVNCKKKEELHHYSYRQRGNIELPDGITVDIVIGRECNSDCVMCYSGQSSKIYSRIKKTKPAFSVPKEDQYWVIENNDVDDTWVNDENFWNQLTQNFTNIDKVKFIGGEPLLSKKFWQWMQHEIVIKEKNNKHLEIVTNGSIFKEDKNCLLTGWKRTNLVVSLDSTEKEYEWIRQGLNWEEVKNNVLEYNKIDDLVLSIHSTVNLFNVASIGNLVKWATEHNLLIVFTPVMSPSLLSINYAPIHILKKTLDDISSVKSNKIQNKIQFRSLKNFLKDAIENNKENVELRKSITSYFNNHRRYHMDWETLTCTI